MRVNISRLMNVCERLFDELVKELLLANFTIVSALPAIFERSATIHLPFRPGGRVRLKRNISERPRETRGGGGFRMFCDCDEEGPKWIVGGGGTGGVSAAGRPPMLFATSTSLFFRKVISLFYSWIGFFLGRPRLTSFFSIVCLFSIL